MEGGRSQKEAEEQLFVWFTCLNQFRPKWLPSGEEKAKTSRPIAAERPAAPMFFLSLVQY